MKYNFPIPPGMEIIDSCLSIIEDIPTSINHMYRINYNFQKETGIKDAEIPRYIGNSFLIREIGLYPMDIEQMSLTRLIKFVASSRVHLTIANKCYIDFPGSFMISAWPGLAHTLYRPLLVPESHPIFIRLTCLPSIFQYKKPRPISFRCDIRGELIRRVI